MDRLHESVDEFIQQNPAVSFSQLQEHFGTPEQIAATYVSEMDTAVLLRDLKIRRQIVGIASCVAAFVVATWMGVISWAVVSEIVNTNGTYEEGIEYIDEYDSEKGG